MRRRLLSLAVIAILALAIWTTGGEAQNKSQDWPAYSGDKGATKYSTLDQINAGNVRNLQIAWKVSAVPEALRAVYPNAQGNANYSHTPLMVDGMLYMSSGVGVVTALDPATGKVIWFDQMPPGPNGQPGRGGSTRSLAYWTDGKDARIITNVGSSLVAINAKTGKRYPDFGDNGQVDLTKGFERQSIVTGWRSSSGVLVVRRHRRRRCPLTRHRHPQRKSPRTQRDAARRHPRLRRAHGQAPVDLQRGAAQGRIRQRHLVERLVDLLGQQRRLVADERG
jgi:hypothetical protein